MNKQYNTHDKYPHCLYLTFDEEFDKGVTPQDVGRFYTQAEQDLTTLLRHTNVEFEPSKYYTGHHFRDGKLVATYTTGLVTLLEDTYQHLVDTLVGMGFTENDQTT